jgi:hypothetical protein
MMGACACGLSMMLSYYAYVFRFLEPVNLVARIGREAAETVTSAATTRAPTRSSTNRCWRSPALDELTNTAQSALLAEVVGAIAERRLRLGLGRARHRLLLICPARAVGAIRNA